MTTFRNHFLFCLSLIIVSLVFVGCPSQEGPKDGGPGTGPQVATCSAGDHCLFLNDPAAKACEVLLTADTAQANTDIGFTDGIVGQGRASGKRVALSFLAPNERAGVTAAAVLRVKEGDAPGYKVSVVRCYDAAGKAIEGAAVDIKKQ